MLSDQNRYEVAVLGYDDYRSSFAVYTILIIVT